MPQITPPKIHDPGTLQHIAPCRRVDLDHRLSVIGKDEYWMVSARELAVKLGVPLSPSYYHPRWDFGISKRLPKSY